LGKWENPLWVRERRRGGNARKAVKVGASEIPVVTLWYSPKELGKRGFWFGLVWIG